MYDPQAGTLDGWTRCEGSLVRITEMQGWVSPLLGVCFGLENGELVLYRPDGERFVPCVELHRRYEQAQREAEKQRQRAERLAQRLRELGIEVDGA